MNYTKNQLQETIISLHRNTPKEFKGYTSKEIALMVGKETQDIHQVLKRLLGKGILFRRKEKRGVEKSTFVYYFNEYGLITESSCFNTCNKCQWFSGLEHCILLNKTKEDSPWSLTSEQKKRTEAVSLHSVPACDKFAPRVNGKWKSKTLKDFVKRNTNQTTLEFHCPIKRSGKVIDELSDPMQLRNIGANTLYCPHCGSPINFAYDNGLARYQVQYWDSRFDILQNSYSAITGLELIDRFQADRPNGVSITKHRSYYLDLENEVLYVGSEMTPEEFNDSKDLA
ncbi:MAG: hypothetical protein ACTSQX_07850, partial [Candidatus Heimdallarchaeota archaeon]